MKKTTPKIDFCQELIRTIKELLPAFLPDFKAGLFTCSYQRGYYQLDYSYNVSGTGVDAEIKHVESSIQGEYSVDGVRQAAKNFIHSRCKIDLQRRIDSISFESKAAATKVKLELDIDKARTLLAVVKDYCDTDLEFHKEAASLQTPILESIVSAEFKAKAGTN